MNSPGQSTSTRLCTLHLNELKEAIDNALDPIRMPSKKKRRKILSPAFPKSEKVKDYDRMTHDRSLQEILETPDELSDYMNNRW